MLDNWQDFLDAADFAAYARGAEAQAEVAYLRKMLVAAMALNFFALLGAALIVIAGVGAR